MKYFFLVLFQMLTVLTFSQQIKIDQINSDQQVYNFIQQENYSPQDAPQWKFFNLTDGTEWNSYYNLSKQQTDSVGQLLPHTSWQKIDLNNDGKPDLIVSGYVARRPKDWNTATFKLLVFLSQRGNEYVELNLLDNRSEKYPAYFNALSMNGNNCLQVFRWQLDAEDMNVALPLQTDTVQYNGMLNNFVNSPNYLASQDIQKINYLVKDDGNNASHQITLINPNNNKSKYIDVIVSLMPAGSKSPITYKAKMQLDLWQTIDTLARSISFRSDSVVLRSETNRLPIITTMYFADGTKKTITDFGGNMSFSLSALYQAFDEMIEDTYNQYQQRREEENDAIDDFLGAVL